MWKDYQNGRNMRKQIIHKQDPGTGDDGSRKAEDETQKLRHRGIPALAAKKSSPSKHYHENRLERRAKPRPVTEHWVHQGGEWPWKIEQVVHRDSSGNTRGIWVLEAKDPASVCWETEERSGRRIPATVPQPQWPFPHQGKRKNGVNCPGMEEERDELMEWLWEW
jgi:hypothetical protein